VNEPDPRRIADAFPRRPSPRHRDPEPSTDEIEQAQQVYESHIPSMFTHLCLGCEERWACRAYRQAEALLQHAGLLAPPAGPSG